MSAPYPNGRLFPAAGEDPPTALDFWLANGRPLHLELLWTHPSYWDWARQGQAANDAMLYVEWLQFHDEVLE